MREDGQGRGDPVREDGQGDTARATLGLSRAATWLLGGEPRRPSLETREWGHSLLPEKQPSPLWAPAAAREEKGAWQGVSA